MFNRYQLGATIWWAESPAPHSWLDRLDLLDRSRSTFTSLYRILSGDWVRYCKHDPRSGKLNRTLDELTGNVSRRRAEWGHPHALAHYRPRFDQYKDLVIIGTRNPSHPTLSFCCFWYIVLRRSTRLKVLKVRGC